MDLKQRKQKYIEKKSLDELIRLYQNDKITYKSFISCLIDRQKRLVINDIVRGKDGPVAGEILLRRMSNAGIDIVI